MHENYDEALLLELVKSKQFRALRAHLDEMNEVDIAEFLDELEPDQQVVVFRLLPKDVAADVFTYLEDSEDQEKIINALSDKELLDVVTDAASPLPPPLGEVPRRGGEGSPHSTPALFRGHRARTARPRT